MSVALRAGCEPRCRACSHRELSMEESLLRKREWLRRALAPWAAAVEPVRSVADEERWGYREKSVLRAEWDGSRWKLGLRLAREGVRLRRSERYELLPIPGCPVHSERVRRIFEAVSERVPAEIPLVFVAVSGTLLTLVLKSAQEPVPVWIDALRPAELGLEGVLLNLNPSAGERVFSSRGWKLAWGTDTALDPRTGLRYGPDSFSQLLPALHGEALREARGHLAPGAGDSVVDLCSGAGASLRLWAPARAIGVELNGEAVRCAETNVGPGAVIRGRVSERLPQLDSWMHATGRRLAFANPPRLGLEPEAAEWLARRYRPARIAYLSCSAGTLARDLSLLDDAGYAVRRIIPYDFFPQTHHVEALALLELDPDRDLRGASDPRMGARPHG